MKLQILQAAEEEIEAARQWLNRQSFGLGSRFLDDLAATLTDISDRPLSYTQLETLPDDAPYRRALLRKFKYAVIYEIVGEEIVVVAVAHTSREPNYWLDRN